jgi:hypothetical protein
MNWWWATVTGPLVLIGVIAYAVSKERGLSPREKQEQRRAVDRVYDEPEHAREIPR